ncbi:MAG TPA: hypothetical protein VEC12_03020 [Bacteroidia bacterium]|nr:hypothetical protein [Bacteroidia bacterium]
MNRKTFLKRAFQNVIKPVALAAVVYFCVTFLITAIKQNQLTNLLIILIGGFLLFAVASLAGTFTARWRQKIYLRLSQKVKFYLKVTGRVIDYAAVMALGVLLYKFLEKDLIGASIFITILFFSKIVEVISQEKVKARY